MWYDWIQYRWCGGIFFLRCRLNPIANEMKKHICVHIKRIRFNLKLTLISFDFCFTCTCFKAFSFQIRILSDVKLLKYLNWQKSTRFFSFICFHLMYVTTLFCDFAYLFPNSSFVHLGKSRKIQFKSKIPLDI